MYIYFASFNKMILLSNKTKIVNQIEIKYDTNQSIIYIYNAYLITINTFSFHLII